MQHAARSKGQEASPVSDPVTESNVQDAQVWQGCQRCQAGIC